MNGYATLTNLHTTNFDIVAVQILFYLFSVSKTIKFNLFISSMITKQIKFFHGFHLFTLIGFVSYVDNLLQPESTGTSDDISDIIFLRYIMKKKISFW